VVRFRRIVADVFSGAADCRARPISVDDAPAGENGEFSNPPTTYM
jgi:hypothetical protein